MRELLQLAWDTLLFRDAGYAQHVARADVLKRGLTLLVVVSLAAGVLSLLTGLVRDLRPMSVEAQREEVEQALQQFSQSMRQMGQFTDIPPGFERQLTDSIRSGMALGFEIEALPTRLPKPIARLFTNLGSFLSLPFSRFASWAGYTIWVMLIAKLLGGRATVSQTLGATALYAVPHVLGILDVVPCLGGLLGLVAAVWGIAIYVKALAVANEFTIGRAVVATVVPALVGAALALMGLLFLLILALAGG
jgi:hypothetical protein